MMATKPATARQIAELEWLNAPGHFLTIGGYRRDVDRGHFGSVALNTLATLIRRGYVERVQTWAGDSYIISILGNAALPPEPEREAD